MGNTILRVHWLTTAGILHHRILIAYLGKLGQIFKTDNARKKMSSFNMSNELKIQFQSILKRNESPPLRVLIRRSTTGSCLINWILVKSRQDSALSARSPRSCQENINLGKILVISARSWQSRQDLGRTDISVALSETEMLMPTRQNWSTHKYLYLFLVG